MGGWGFCPICKIYWDGFCPSQQKRVGGILSGGGFCPDTGLLGWLNLKQFLDVLTSHNHKMEATSLYDRSC